MSGLDWYVTLSPLVIAIVIGGGGYWLTRFIKSGRGR